MTTANKVIVLSHIAKTAGTSLNYIFRRHFGSRLMACLFREGAEQQAYFKQNLEKDLAIFGKCECISGHCLRPWVDFDRQESQFQRILFVRQAKKRFLSLYAHEQTFNNDHYHMNLRDWASTFDRSDGMVKYIAGEKNLQKAIDIIEEKNIYVGMQDQYQASLSQIIKIMALSNFDTKTEKKKMEIKDSSIINDIQENAAQYDACIAENNILDDQLYQYVQKQVWPRQTALAESLPEPDSYNSTDKHWQFWLMDRLIYKPHLLIESVAKRA